MYKAIYELINQLGSAQPLGAVDDITLLILSDLLTARKQCWCCFPASDVLLPVESLVAPQSDCCM